MNTFFTAISQALTDSNKRINIDVSGLEGGRVKVVLSANIGPTPAKASEAEIKLRAAIAKPMMLSGTADSTPSGHPVHAHLARHSTAIWPPVPRPSGRAVGAQR
ncbi:hypothetical protein MX648_18070, partial [Pseudomonas aeruginosa]|nr:hypothetical protein [Pseudomonas aeruginosa]